MSSQQKVKILLADPSENFHGLLDDKDNPILKKCEFVICTKGSDAIEKIKDDSNDFQGVLISNCIESPDPISIFKVSITSQPTIPITYLDSLKHMHFSEKELISMGVRSILHSPFDLQDVLDSFGIDDFVYGKEQALEIGKKYKDEDVDKEIDETDDGFQRIPAQFFVSGKESLFDIYVKLRKDKFVKIVRSGDMFEAEKVVSYIQKGVLYFFIRNDSLEEYVKFCDHLASKASQSKKLELNKKFGLLVNQAETTINFLGRAGVDKESVRYAKKVAKNMINAMADMQEKNAALKNLLGNLKSYEHSVSVSCIGSMALKKMGLASEKFQEMFNLACILHDIGLVVREDEAEKINIKAGELIVEKDLKEKVKSKKVFGDEKTSLNRLWLEHPERAAEILEGQEDITSIVIQIIRQHHSYEFKASHNKSYGPVHPLAEVLEAANEIVEIIEKIDIEKLSNNSVKSLVSAALKNFPKRISEPLSDAFI